MNPIDQMMQMFGTASSGMLSALMANKTAGTPQGAGQTFGDILTGVTATGTAAPGKFVPGQQLEGTDDAGMSASDYMFAIGPYNYTVEPEAVPAPDGLPDTLGMDGSDGSSGDADLGGTDGMILQAPADEDQNAAGSETQSSGKTDAAAQSGAPGVQPQASAEPGTSGKASSDSGQAHAKVTGQAVTDVAPEAGADKLAPLNAGDTQEDKPAAEVLGADEPVADIAEASDTSADDAMLAAERAANAARAQSVDHPKPADVVYASVAAETLDEPAVEADLPAQASEVAKAQATHAKSKAPSSPNSIPSATELADEAADDAGPALAQAQTTQQKPADTNTSAKSAAAKATAASKTSSEATQNAVAQGDATASQPAPAAERGHSRDTGPLFASADRSASSNVTPESLTGQTDTSSQTLIGGGLSTLKGESALFGRPAATGFTPQPQANYVLNQVNVQIAKAVDAGDQNFTVRLDPPELGRVTVKMQFGQDGTVRAEVVADRRETLDMLRRDTKSLEKALEAGGHKADMDGLSFSLDDGASQESAGKAFAEAMLADRIDERNAGQMAAGTDGGAEGATADDAGESVLHLDSTDLEAILPYVTAETGIDVRV